PYQQAGVRWLHLLSSLGLGACLADDMGLGKTMQVLALLLILRKTSDASGAGHGGPASEAAGSGGGAPRLKEDETRRASLLVAQARIALSGTPVENRLGDLWSIFDFLNPGLLGSGKAFSTFTKRLSSQPQNPYAPLRTLVRPYILRRLKTDKSVIGDLPDKTEVRAFCHLSRKQAALYQQSVADLATSLEASAGRWRTGSGLAALVRLKQVCTHPYQWLYD